MNWRRRARQDGAQRSVVNPLPKRLIEIGPLHEREVPMKAGSDPTGEHRTLDRDRSRSTKRVEQWRFHAPLRREEKRRSEGFANGGLCRGLTIPASMEKLPRRVDAEQTMIVCDADEHHLSVGGVLLSITFDRFDPGSAYSLFDPLGDALRNCSRVIQARLPTSDAEPNGTRRIEIPFPRLMPRLFHELGEASHAELRDARDDPTRRPRVYVRAVHC